MKVWADIIDRANLGRSTFYAHYQSKDDLLLNSIDNVVHSLIWGIENAPMEVEGNGQSLRILSALPIFRHAQERHRLHQTMIGGRDIDILIKEIQNYPSRHIQEQIEQLLPDGKTSSAAPPIISRPQSCM